MSTAVLAVIAVILCILFRILNVSSAPQKPTIYCGDANFMETVLKISPLIQEPYVPTRLWGFSGHVQTIIHSIIGRVKCPWPIGERVALPLADGSTLTFDIYQPLEARAAAADDDVTLAICPGIGNTSESVYIRTFVHYAQCHGYRCAVLNHVGALHTVPVTAPRIFSYGNTSDYCEMLNYLQQRDPQAKIVCIGFSLGGNIVTKYMGELDKEKPKNIIGGVSICQGYCAIEAGSWYGFTFAQTHPENLSSFDQPYLAMKWLLNWQNFRRFYLYVMTENVKSIIIRHRHVLLSEDVKNRYNINEHDVIAAATLPELDDAYTRRILNFNNITELYKWSSSVNYLSNIQTPMVFINAKDDPIVPEPLLNYIKKHTMEHQKSMFIEVAHGGHLGFYEGGLVYPNPVTWLDRTLVSMVGSLVFNHHDGLKNR